MRAGTWWYAEKWLSCVCGRGRVKREAGTAPTPLMLDRLKQPANPLGRDPRASIGDAGSNEATSDLSKSRSAHVDQCVRDGQSKMMMMMRAQSIGSESENLV